MNDQLTDPDQSIEQMQLRASQAIFMKRPHEAIMVTIFSFFFQKLCMNRFFLS